jgi:predicted DNA-binding ribbon-helix-helix protein
MNRRSHHVAASAAPRQETARLPDRKLNQSAVMKRSVVLGNHRTSVSLEAAFWTSVKEIARGCGTSVSELLSRIDADRAGGNLSSAIRLFVLDHYRSRCDEGSVDGARSAADAVLPDHGVSSSGAG